MNLPVIFSKIAQGAKSLGGNALLFGKKHTPELLMAASAGGLVLTVAETVKATNETNEILNEKERRLAICDSNLEDDAEGDLVYTKEDYQNDVRTIARQTKWRLVKVWLPVAGSFIFVLVTAGGAYKIINGRYVAAVAAYDGLDKFTKRYRQNVIDEFGNEVDWRMAHSVKAEEIEAAKREREENRAITDGNPNKKTNRKPKTAYQEINNQIFDSQSSERWQKYWLPQQALDYVHWKETQLQDKLRLNGHVFLNEAYEMLGLPPTPQGQLLGWINTPRNCHEDKGYKLSLGYENDELPESELRRILSTKSNDELFLWITPNCDGVIYNLIDKPFSER